LSSGGLSAGEHRKCERQMKKDCRTQGSPNSTREDFDSRDECIKNDQ
jgi:hypothetical protein